MIGKARIIDPIQIDDTCIEQATQLQKLMPVTAVPSETRSVEAENGTDLFRTEFGAQSLEALPVHLATGRQPLVIVDHFHIPKAPTAGGRDKFVLPSLTLQIAEHLLRRGLADIDHRFAAQNGSSKQLRRRHRDPPPVRRLLLRAADWPVAEPPDRARPVSLRQFVLAESQRQLGPARQACRRRGVVIRVLPESSMSSRHSRRKPKPIKKW